jgi:hypothetical protein
MSSALAVNERATDQQLDASMLPGLTPTEIETLKKVFSSPLDIPAEWKAWIVSYLEANPPQIPIAQVLGFSAFTANYGSQPLSSAITVANAWQSLSNTGPSLLNLPKGKYVLLYGCNYDATGGATGYMGYCVNGASVPTAYVAIAPVNVERFMLMKADVVDLPLDSVPNTITFMYQASQVGPSFSNRWALALKYANL